jgi:hypothetical protein
VTGAYSPSVAELVKVDHTQIHALTVDAPGVEDFILPAENVTVKFSEDWAPHIQASLDVPASLTQAQLSAIDPRRNARIKIEAGYQLASGSNDLQLLADLGFRDRSVTRPNNKLGLTASSDEARAMDRLRVSAGEVFPSFGGINEAVQWLADYAVYPETAQLHTDYPNGTTAWAVAGLQSSPGSTFWSPIEDAAARSGVWVYCTGSRKWRVSGRPSNGGTIQHALEVGLFGTVEESDSKLSRTEWANQSIVEYRWRDAAGEDQSIVGHARVTSGPFSVNSVGYKGDFKSYERAATQAQAEAVAGGRVRNLVSRGRGVTVSAVSAYWLRPGHSITVRLPLGIAEEHIIRSIEFNLGDGRMTIETRQPLDVTITTGE